MKTETTAALNVLPSTMSAEQVAYATAHAALDSAYAEIAHRAPAPASDAPEIEVDAWLDAGETIRAEPS